MCLAVPAKVIAVDGSVAVVDIGGNRREANLVLLPGVAIGDYVLVHAGFAISKYEPEDAEETLRVLVEAARLVAEADAAAGVVERDREGGEPS